MIGERDDRSAGTICEYEKRKELNQKVGMQS